MSKIVPACSIDEMLNKMRERIAKLEGRLSDMEQSLQIHVLDNNIHVKHKSYRSKSRLHTSPPPPPPGNINNGFKPITAPPITRHVSAPGRIQTPVNDGISKTSPQPPPLPNKLRL